MRKPVPLLLLALVLLLTGCASRADPALLALAPDEDHRLTVYTSHKEEVYAPIIKEFQERTGIWVEVTTGGTGELLDRIETEASSPRCDVMFGGGVESLLSYVNYLEPCPVPGAEKLKPGLRAQGDLWTPFSSLPIVLIYNTRLVSPGEVSGWGDLLEETWAGRIAFADPALSGSAYTALYTLLTALPGEADALDRFGANLAGSVLPDSGDVVTAVANGSRAVGITLEQTAVKALAQGENIAMVYPVEGTSDLPDGTALVVGAPHRDNGLAFLEFVLSRDAQELTVRELSRRTVRVDVADRPDLPAAGDFPVVAYDIAAAAREKESLLARWRQATGEVSP